MKLLKILCWLGRHDWKFVLNFIEEPERSTYGDYGSNHYSGTCKRCGKRDLFRGPYDPSQSAEATS